MLNQNDHLHPRAFTLIELLVVISIIGLLASIVYASLGDARQKGRIAAGAQFHSHAFHAVGAFLAAAYVFDDQASGQATDSSGNSQTAAFGGAPSYTTDVPFGSGRSIYLNGSSYLTAPDSSALRLSTYTVSVWIKPNGAPAEWVGIIGKPGRNFNMWLHPNAYIHHRFHNSGSTNAGAPNTPTNSILLNQWNEVTITNDGTTVRTFINGELKASGSSGGLQIVDNTPLYIGRNLDGAAGNYFVGWIDDIFISSEPLSMAAVEKRYARLRQEHEENALAAAF